MQCPALGGTPPAARKIDNPPTLARGRQRPPPLPDGQDGFRFNQSPERPVISSSLSSGLSFNPCREKNLIISAIARDAKTIVRSVSLRSFVTGESAAAGGRKRRLMNATEACIALNMLPTIGPVRLRKLLEVFKEPQNNLQQNGASCGRLKEIGNEIADQVSIGSQLSILTRS
jgi:hypothetical protein